MAKRSNAPAPVAAGQTDQLTIDIPAAARRPKTIEIARSLIHPDPEQPREHADDELRGAIAVEGLIEPIIVRPHPSIASEWMIVNGERRWRGCEGVLNDLPCIVRHDLEDPARRLTLQLIANYGKPTPPLDEAKAFHKLHVLSGMTVTELARTLGRAPSTVAERLALLELGPWLPAIEGGLLPMSHAVKVLLPIRGIPESIHATLVSVTIRRDADQLTERTVEQFRKEVLHALRPYAYPLEKSTTYGAKNPAFNTKKHDQECECGGPRLVYDQYEGGARRFCVDTSWWKPRDAEAVKKAKSTPAKAPAQAVDRSGLLLPKKVPAVDSQYGHTPKGVVRLSDPDGCWDTPHRDAFDPQDLDVPESSLVLWKGQYDELPCVGTTDLEAVSVAREKWAARWEAERARVAASFGGELRAAMLRHRVSGPGASVVLRLIERGDGDELPLIEIADALSITVPDEFTTLDRWELLDAFVPWALGLSAGQVELLASAIAACVLGEIKTPDDAVLELEGAARAEIRQRLVPWVKPEARRVDDEDEDDAPTKTHSGLEGDEDDFGDEDEELDGPGAGDEDEDEDDLWDAAGDEDDEEEAPLVQARKR